MVVGLVAILAVGFMVLSRGGDEGSVEGTTPSERAEGVLRGYLEALAEGEYEAAAVLLVGGGEPLDEREDLVVLGLDELSVEALAGALESYCPVGCVAPTAVTVEDVDPEGEYRVTAGFGEPRGHPLVRPFVVGSTRAGEPYVRGLPPRELSPIPAAPPEAAPAGAGLATGAAQSRDGSGRLPLLSGRGTSITPIA
ncbi:MAG: hypothetical protein ACRD2C_03945 [Acidimicrobiales bacterium]